MGKTCEPKAFSFQCMTKFTKNKKNKKKKKKKRMNMQGGVSSVKRETVVKGRRGMKTDHCNKLKFMGSIKGPLDLGTVVFSFLQPH